jgi:class 3 adenylate cyclase
VPALWHRLVQIGVEPGQTGLQSRYIVLTNSCALLGVLFTLSYVPMTLLSPSYLLTLAQLSYAPSYLPALWFNHRRRPQLATAWMLCASQGLIVLQVLVSGPALGIQSFFLLHAVLPFLLYPPQHTRAMLLTSGTGLTGYLLLTVLGDALPRLGPVTPPQVLQLLVPTMYGGLYASMAACGYYARRVTLAAEAEMERQFQRSEELLLNILPLPIAERLKQTPGTIADAFGEVTVLFADIVGFTKLSARLPPERIVSLLNRLFSAFDDLAERHQLEKIKTIGDAYMVAGGLPTGRADHAEAIAEMALGMLEALERFRRETGEEVSVRIGVHSGPAVAGVIGKKKFIYDLWGDTVNTASRMESHGMPGTIQVSESTFQLLAPKYRLRPRGIIEVKGKGEMATYFLEGRAMDSEPVPAMALAPRS